MSYNVDHAEYIGEGRLTISRSDREGLLAVHEDELCECNFIDPYNEECCLVAGDDPDTWIIKRPWWYGEGSGRGVADVLVKHILPLTKGHAQILLVWEGGDSITGLEVTDGVVVEREVIFTLGKAVNG